VFFWRRGSIAATSGAFGREIPREIGRRNAIPSRGLCCEGGAAAKRGSAALDASEAQVRPHQRCRLSTGTMKAAPSQSSVGRRSYGDDSGSQTRSELTETGIVVAPEGRGRGVVADAIGPPVNSRRRHGRFERSR